MRSRLLLLLLVVAYWSIGFYPFQLTGPFTFQRGEITRSADNGFVFAKRSIATNHTVTEWLGHAIHENRLDIQFTVRGYNTETKKLARILTISRNDDYRNLTIAQKQENLVIHIRTVNQKPEGDAYVIPRVFAQAEQFSVGVMLMPDQIRIEIDGEERLRAKLPDLFMQSWDREYALALGNELSYAFPWQGELSPIRIRIGKRDLNYVFDDFDTAGSYQTGLSLLDYKLRNSVSFQDWRQNVLADWVVNFLGFIPFGFLLVLLQKRPVSLMTGGLLCCLFSLSIETGQFFIEHRTPQLIDLILNTLGGSVGVWLGAWASHLGWHRMPQNYL